MGQRPSQRCVPRAAFHATCRRRRASRRVSRGAHRRESCDGDLRRHRHHDSRVIREIIIAHASVRSFQSLLWGGSCG